MPGDSKVVSAEMKGKREVNKIGTELEKMMIDDVNYADG